MSSTDNYGDEIESVAIDGWNTALDGSAVNITTTEDYAFPSRDRGGDSKASNFVNWGNSKTLRYV